MPRLAPVTRTVLSFMVMLVAPVGFRCDRARVRAAGLARRRWPGFPVRGRTAYTQEDPARTEKESLTTTCLRRMLGVPAPPPGFRRRRKPVRRPLPLPRPAGTRT